MLDGPNMTEAGDRLLAELMRFKPDELTPNGWAVKAGVSRTIWSDLRRHGNPSRRTLEKLLAAAGTSLAEFEALRIGDRPKAPQGAGRLGDGPVTFRPAPSATMPLFATQQAGSIDASGQSIGSIRIDRSSEIGRIPRPASLIADRAAYAVLIIDDAMWPRFRPGRRIAVSPAASVGVGDDVLAILRRDGGEQGELAVLGELVSRSPRAIELRQHKPGRIFRIPSADVFAIHKVMGELF
jgi:phage repressor protein C with HTH and peptisase S24 domain